MNNNTVYWKMVNGKSISVDDMDITHLRNAFKMLIKSNALVIEEYNSLIKSRAAERDKTNFKLTGEMSQEFNDSYYDDEDEYNEDAYGDPDYWDGDGYWNE